MKQVVQNYKTGELSLQDIPLPQVRPGGVLVRNAYSLISAGTERGMIDFARRNLVQKARLRPDLVRKVLDKARTEGVLTVYHKAMQRLDTVIPLGYSTGGIVIAVGEQVSDLEVGTHVACAGVGYASHAEVVFVPRNLCAPIPVGTGLRQASFATLGAIALQGVRTAAVSLGDLTSVIGLGLVGQLSVQILKAAGCRVIGMDLDPARCQLARELGADFTTSDRDELLAASSRLSSNLGTDAILITAATPSNDPLELAGNLARDRAHIVVVGQVGMAVPRKVYYEKELSLLMSRSYGPGRYDRSYEEQGVDYPAGYVRWTENRNMQAFLDLLAQGKVNVDRLITHEFGIDEALQAYRLIMGDKQEPHNAVLLTYPTAERRSESGTIRLNPAPGKLTDKHAASVLGRQPVGIGVIGAGDFARGVLLPALKRIEGIHLRGICSQGGVSARAAAERFGFAYCSSDPNDLFKDPSIRAVLIATRPASHEDLLTAALSSGKSVFVEKPLAVNLDQLRKIVSTAKTQGSIVLMVGFNRRFSSYVQQVKEFFRNRRGPLMATYRINANPLPSNDWQHDPEQGGGRIIGEAGHFIDLLSYVMSSVPTEVYAHSVADSTGLLLRNENVALTVRFQDGSLGVVVYMTGGTPGFPKERLEVFGDGAAAVIDDFRKLELVRNGHRNSRRNWLGQDKGHRAEIAAFIEAVRRGGPAPVPLEDYLLTTLCTIQAMESLRTGQLQSVDLSMLDADRSGIGG